MNEQNVPRGTEERVKRYLEDIKRGIRNRKKHLEVWQANKEAAYSDSLAVADDVTRIDKLGSFLESRVAALAHRNPRCRIVPRNDSGWEPIDVPVIDPNTGPVTEQIQDPMTGQVIEIPQTRRVPRFKVLENAVNYLLSRHDFRAAASGRLCVKSALYTGIGCMSVGYSADYEDVDDDVAATISLDEAMLMDVAWLRENYEFSEPDQDGVAMPQVDSLGNLVPKGQIPISEQWFIDWVDTEKVIFDPDGENDPHSMRWVAIEEWRRLEDVKRDKRLKNTKDLKATGRSVDEDEDFAAKYLDDLDNPKNEAKKMVQLFTLWDFDRGSLVVLAKDHDKPLRDDPIPDGVCRKTGPFVYYRPDERPSEWYCKAPLTNLRKISNFYNDANRQAMQELRKATAKILGDSRFLTAANKDRLNSPEKEVIILDMDQAPAGATLEHAVTALKYPSLAPEMFQYTRYIAQNFDEVAGQPGESRGVATANTATQTNALTSREFMREEYQRGIYAETWRAAVKKLVDSLQTNMTIEQAITIMEGDGYAWLAMLTPDMIQGDYDVEVDVEDLEPMNKQQDRANLVNLLTIVGQSPWLAADEQAFDGMCDMFGLHDKRIAKGIARMAEMQMMMLMAPKQPQKTGSAAPENEGDAIAQQGGGTMYGG